MTVPPVPGPPEVSVIVPCWNAAASVARALASVLAECDIRLECVVVDDGSTDASVDVVREVAARDPRIILLASPANEGVSAARNRGLDVVRGAWLTFLDADDRLLPGALAALYRTAVSTGALAVVGQRIWSDGHRTWITDLYDRPEIRVPGRKSLVGSPGLMFYASGTGKLFHRSTFGDLRFQGRVLGDQPWTIRALLRAGDRIEVIGDDVYEWTRPAPGSDWATITAAKHGSARLAAEAVRVAVGALQDVAEEADRVLPSPEDRRSIVAGYFRRLVTADLAGPVLRAAAGADDGAPELFEAVAAFLRAAPPDVVASSTAVPARLLWRPFVHWRRMSRETRTALWSMVAAVDDAGRATPGAPRRARAATRLLARAGSAWQGRARPVVDALLGLASIAIEGALAVRARIRGAR